jgi:flagellar hook protein FlgE
MVLGVNLPATSTEPGATTGDEVLTLEYFDNLGKSQDLDVTFSPTVPTTAPASNEWTMQVRDRAQGGALIGEATLAFQDTPAAGGTIGAVTATTGTYDAATGNLTIAASSGPIAMTIGRPGGYGAMTQLSDSFAPGAIQKDGAPPGNIVQIDIDPNGLVNALFDTGITRTLYQVPLADVPNPNGLIALDNQAYRPSNTSGAFFLWDAGTGPTGDLVNYAREESTTDVAAELTDLIQTQRAYSSNAKVIQTVDEMLQETTNIKR